MSNQADKLEKAREQERQNILGIVKSMDVKPTSEQNIGWHNCLVQLEKEIVALTKTVER